MAHAGGLIQAVLLINPFVGVSAVLGYDIVRTEGLYHLSPIGQRQFVYPPWYVAAAVSLLAAFGLIAGTIWRVAYLRRHTDVWRM
jgi:hypothetical protein